MWVKLIEDNVWLITGTGLVVIVFLVLIINKQWKLLVRIKQESEVLAGSRAARSNEILSGITVLCKSMVDGQVEISEGCMRVKILLDHFDPSLHLDPRFTAFNDVYNQLEDMPRFGARRTVDKQSLKVLDARRLEVELDNKDAVLAASRSLIDYISSQN